MGVKSIISAVAFAGTFTMSSGLAMLWPGTHRKPAPSVQPVAILQPATPHRGCSKGARTYYDARAQQRISQFIQQDINNGNRRDQSLSDYDAAVARYVREMGALDANELPADFRNAWNAHVAAWRDYSNFVKWRDRNGDDDSDFSQLMMEKNEAISDTWLDVKQVAYRYGATFEE